MCIQLTELSLPIDTVVLKQSFCRICKWIFGDIWRLWWRWKYLPIGTRQKLSQKLLCDVCIHITDWNSTSDRAVLKQSFCRICKCSFGALWSLRWRRKYLHLKTGQKHSEQILWDVRTQLTELNLCFDRAVLKHSFCRICLWIYVTLWGIRWKRDFSYKTRQKYSEKVPCDVGNHLTELKFLLILQFWNTLFVESASVYLERFDANSGRGNISR